MYVHSVVMGRRPDNKIILSCLVLSPPPPHEMIRHFGNLRSFSQILDTDPAAAIYL